MSEPAVSKETKRVIQEMKKFSRDVTSSSKKSKEFLVKAGICTAKGDLRKVYK